MAETVSLVRRADGGTSNISTLEVFSSTSTLSISDWTPQVMGEDEQTCIETMRFRVNGTSDNNLATITQGLAQKVREARQANQPGEKYQVYLKDQLASETNARYAVVHAMKVESGNFWHSYPTRQQHKWEGLSLAIERGPWESSDYRSMSDTGVSTMGGTFSAGTQIYGDIPARIFDTHFAVSSGTIHEAWWGFVSSNDITIGNWTGKWELEKGSLSGAGTLGTSSAYSNGTAVLVNFSDSTAMSTRVTITPYQVSSANYDDLRGSYQCVLRAKVDSGYTCRVRVFSGLGSGYAYNEPITISGTTLYLYDVGRVSIPCGGLVDAFSLTGVSYSTRNSIVGIQAELYSGAQNAAKYLYLDCLFMIPVHRGYGHYKGSVTGDANIYSDSLGRIAGRDESTSSVTALETSGITPDTCVIPLGTALCVVVGQRLDQSNINDTISPVFLYYPRWLMFRGSADTPSPPLEE